jgi:integration host factor alpha subunit
MTKADLVETLFASLQIPKKDSAEIVEAILETVKEAVENGETVKIAGFGTFHVRAKKTRVGRNPKTGASMEIPARRVLAFRPGQHLKHALNSHGRNGAAHRNGRA